MRRRRSIGSWISDFFKKWKKDDSGDDYGGQQIITVPVYQPRPIYHPPVVQKPYYPPPAYGPPAIPPTSYGGGFGGGGQFKGGFGGGGFGGGGHGGGGHIKGGFGGGGFGGGGHGGGGHIKGGFGGGGPIKGGFGGGGPIKGGFGGGGPIKGGFGGGGAIKGGFGGGGAIKGGYGGGGGHIKGGFGGGGGHIKGGFGGGGGHIKGGFGGGGGHIKGGGGGGHAKGIPYGFGPVKHSDVVLGGGSYHPPALPAGGYGAPPPLPLDTYAAPILDDVYGPPKIVDTYSTLAIPKAPIVSPGLGDSYIPPVAPVNDLGSAHGTSSYVDFQPSQPLPIEPVVPEVPLAPKGPPVPLSPLYEIPGDGSALPPAPIDILPPGNGIFDVGGSKRSIDGGFGSVAGINDQYSAPLTYGAELGYDDPIIEIVFEDGEPAPPLPPPVIDPEVFALPEEPVEVYFIEYSPGDNLDDIAALNLEGAKPGILEDLPDELPIDIRSHLLDSGVLDNAEIQVINLDDALTKGYLDRDTREALEAVYASESRRDEKKVDAPSKEGVNIKVHRLMNEDGTPKGVAELLSSLGKYREGRFAGLVEANDEDKNKFIPVIVDGDKLPLPNHPGLDGREVAGVLVLAQGHKNKTSEPPANTSTPVHNLVESASNPAAAKIDPISERVDRQWNGDPNGWRPVWD